MNEKYWGSVIFFKHLFISGFVLIFTLPIGVALYFWHVSEATSKELDHLQNNKSQTVRHAAAPVSGESPEYQKKYPELYAPVKKKQAIAENTAYLTFDDGPTVLTEYVLDVLKKYHIKATFFIIGEKLKTPSTHRVVKRIIDEGHSLGIHTDSHAYRKIYASVDDYLDDFAKAHERIRELTGQDTHIFRFPGGSINTYNGDIYPQLIAEMTRRGYVYFDWNISSGDCDNKTASAVYNNVMKQADKLTRSVILFHDSADKSITLSALPKLIESFQAKGVQFGTLTSEMYPVTFGYRY